MTAARRHTAPGHQLLAFLARSARSFFLVRWRFFCNPRFVFFRLAHKMRFHSMIGKHGLIFGIGQHGGVLSSLCDKRLHNKHLDRIYSPWHDGCSLNWCCPHQIYENYFDSSSSSNLDVGIQVRYHPALPDRTLRHLRRGISPKAHCSQFLSRHSNFSFRFG